MRRRGFTLVEVLLAGLLMGLIVMAVYSLYDSTARLGERAQASGDSVLQAQFAFRRVETDLRSGWVSGLDDELRESVRNRMNAGLASSVTVATADPAQGQAETMLYVGEDGTHAQGPDDYLELICAGGSGLGEAKGDLVRARYYVMRDEQFPHRSTLVRDARPFLAPRLGGTDRSLTEDEVRVVARGVVGFNLRHGAASERRDEWNSSQQNGAWPAVTEIELTIQTSSGHTEKFLSKTYLRVPAEAESTTETASTTEETPK